MTTTELQDLADQARKFSGSDSHATILAALIKAKAIEEAGRAIAVTIDSAARIKFEGSVKIAKSLDDIARNTGA